MVSGEFQILESSKVGLKSEESFIVTRGKTSFLRILGGAPSWELMTATASEDHGRIRVCSDQLRLIESALRLGTELKTCPSVENDRTGREYVKICVLKHYENESEEKFNSELHSLLDSFFKIYNEYTDIRSCDKIEMIDLYKDLAIDDFGGDIYLSDGVWLSKDGSLNDRGR